MAEPNTTPAPASPETAATPETASPESGRPAVTAQPPQNLPDRVGELLGQAADQVDGFFRSIFGHHPDDVVK